MASAKNKNMIPDTEQRRMIVDMKRILKSYYPKARMFINQTYYFPPRYKSYMNENWHSYELRVPSVRRKPYYLWNYEQLKKKMRNKVINACLK